MNYPNGESVQIGDTVYLGGDHRGLVVGIIDEGEYAEGYREEDWKYMGNGVIVNTEFGDFRLEEPDEDFELIARPEPRLRLGRSSR